jgi:hypothetical protein
MLEAITGSLGEFKDNVFCDADLTCGSVMSDDDIIEQVKRDSYDFLLADEGGVLLHKDRDMYNRIITKTEIQKSLKKVYNGLLQRTDIPYTFFKA